VPNLVYVFIACSSSPVFITMFMPACFVLVYLHFSQFRWSVLFKM